MTNLGSNATARMAGRAILFVGLSLFLGVSGGISGCGDDAGEGQQQPGAGDGGLGVIDPGMFELGGRGGRGGATAGAAGGAGTTAEGGASGMQDAAVADAAAPEPPPFDAGGAGIAVNVLTNHPEFGFINSGTLGIELVSAYIWIEEITETFNTLWMHGEMETRGDEIVCILSFNLARLGVVDINVVTDGPPFQLGTIGVSTECLEPGARGVWHAIENEVATDLFDRNSTFRYAITGLVRPEAVPHTLAPIVLSTDMVQHSTGGYLMRGQLRSPAMPIYNVSIRFAARDERGLVMDDANAYPGDHDTLAPSSVFDYESYPFLVYKEKPASLITFVHFIDGVAPPEGASSVLATEPLGEVGLRLQQRREGDEAYRRARQRAEAQR